MLGRFGRLLFSLAIIGIGVETLICSYVSSHKVVPVIPWLPAIPSLAYPVGTIFMLLSGLAFDVPRHSDLMSPVADQCARTNRHWLPSMARFWIGRHSGMASPDKP